MVLRSNKKYYFNDVKFLELVFLQAWAHSHMVQKTSFLA